MGKIIGILLFVFIVISCEKDEPSEPCAPCTGVSMTGDRELFVGTWHWYSTLVEE